jgi:hypothetical protein
MGAFTKNQVYMKQNATLAMAISRKNNTWMAMAKTTEKNHLKLNVKFILF